LRSKDSAVNIATDYVLDDQEVIIRKKIFLLSTLSSKVLGPSQPPLQWVPGNVYLGVKWLGREADRSPPTSAEVINMWIYTSTPPAFFGFEPLHDNDYEKYGLLVCGAM
jgi:hypothetical protein